ncbi:hypothetical protein, partial [Pantoea sp. Cr_R14]|uniref:hypothetical protein n=1 Tax=Pantoea sp. Cr_R14 TaxID=3031019 RepID=UPI0023DAE2D4
MSHVANYRKISELLAIMRGNRPVIALQEARKSLTILLNTACFSRSADVKKPRTLVRGFFTY